MVSFLLTDLNGIFDNDDFGVTATVGGVAITCIFDVPYEGLNPDTGVVESSAPVATVKSSDVTARSIAHSTAIIISGVTYSVIGIEPDGQGMTRLVLEKS